jgi:hypothetical protein
MSIDDKNKPPIDEANDVVFEMIDGVVHIIDLEKHGSVADYKRRRIDPPHGLTDEEEWDAYG